jgi:hypothetical protein
MANHKVQNPATTTAAGPEITSQTMG